MRPRLLLFVLMLTVMLGDLAFQVAQAQDSEVSLLRQMINIAADNGGVGHTAELTALKEQIEALPKPARGDRKTARAANDAGLAALDSGQFERAKKYFLAAAKADPADVEIAGNLGFAAINTGDFKQAIKALSAALALAPGRSSAWVTLGEYFAVQGQRQQAVACYALVYHLSKDRDKTRRFLQKWAVESDNPNVRQAMQQALQLSLISGGKAEDVAVAAIVDEESLDAPLPSAAPASRSLPTAAPPVASLPAPPPDPAASLPAPPPAPAVASLPVPVATTPATVLPQPTVLPPPVIAQPASPDSLPPPDVSVLTNTKADICKEVVRGFLGVTIQEVTPELAQVFGFNKPSGGLVLDVVPTGPAQVAGIKIDDVILTFNNQAITKSSDLLPLVDATSPGTTVPITVFRRGSEKAIFVSIGESPYPLEQRKSLGYTTSPDIEDDLQACECVRRGPESFFRISSGVEPELAESFFRAYSRANPKLAECVRAWSARQQAEKIAARQSKDAQDEAEDQGIKDDNRKNMLKAMKIFPEDFETKSEYLKVAKSLDIRKTDINNDNIEEYIVVLKYSSYCGSLGCSFYILSKSGNAYSVLLDGVIEGDKKDIIIDHTSTNGWKNIVADRNSGPNFHRYIYSYNGSIYTEAKCVEMEDNTRKVIRQDCNDDTDTLAVDNKKYPASSAYEDQESENHNQAKKILEQKGIDYTLDAFMKSADSGNNPVVKLFIEAGMNVNEKDSNGRTALMYASQKMGHASTVQLLLDHGANVNEKDKDGVTALMSALFLQITDTMQILIEKGADINAKEKTGFTPLMLASSLGSNDIVKFLLAKGSDINATDNDGRTALMYASSSGHIGVMKALLDKGANINLKDKSNKSALAASKSPDTIKFLLEKWTEVNLEDMCKVQAGQSADSMKGMNWYLDPRCIQACPALMINLYKELGVKLNLEKQSESVVLLTRPSTDTALLFFRDQESCKAAAKFK